MSIVEPSILHPTPLVHLIVSTRSQPVRCVARNIPFEIDRVRMGATKMNVLVPMKSATVAGPNTHRAILVLIGATPESVWGFMSLTRDTFSRPFYPAFDPVFTDGPPALFAGRGERGTTSACFSA